MRVIRGLSGLMLQKEMGGTLGFMPPEQLTDFHAMHPSADQYSAAATLYTLLTGEYVHGRSATLAETFHKILQAEPVPIRQRRGDIPADLAAAIHRALARRPEDRFADVAALRQALVPFATGELG